MKKRIILVLIVLVVILGITIVALNYLRKSEKVSVNNFTDCLGANYLVLETYPRQCKTPEGKTFVENIGRLFSKSEFIHLKSPLPNEIIKSPLIIKGEARGLWYFEATFPIKLYDQGNNLIAQTIAQAQGDWMTNDFVPFQAELKFDSGMAKNGILVLEKDNPSGLPENADQLTIPVIFDNQSQKMKVKVYLSNSKLGSDIDCQKVFLVERDIIETPAIARAALEELIKGASEDEKAIGYFSSLNVETKIQKLVIENKVAKVDFSEDLNQTGGSCQVAAIRAQIIQTLKQFSTVEEVVISINGKTEDILQP